MTVGTLYLRDTMISSEQAQPIRRRAQTERERPPRQGRAAGGGEYTGRCHEGISLVPCNVTRSQGRTRGACVRGHSLITLVYSVIWAGCSQTVAMGGSRIRSLKSLPYSMSTCSVRCILNDKIKETQQGNWVCPL